MLSENLLLLCILITVLIMVIVYIVYWFFRNLRIQEISRGDYRYVHTNEEISIFYRFSNPSRLGLNLKAKLLDWAFGKSTELISMEPCDELARGYNDYYGRNPVEDVRPISHRVTDFKVDQFVISYQIRDCHSGETQVFHYEKNLYDDLCSKFPFHVSVSTDSLYNYLGSNVFVNIYASHFSDIVNGTVIFYTHMRKASQVHLNTFLVA
jgi:hypothetical protein